MVTHIEYNSLVEFAEINWNQLPPLPEIKNLSLLKFLHFDDLKFWTQDETIKISNTRIFKDRYTSMEIKNNRINDPFEGVSNLAQGEFSDENTIQVGNLIEKRLEDFHLLSFAKGNLNDLSGLFCAPDIGIEHPYDACIEIVDVEPFAQILKSALVRNPDNGDYSIPIGALFSRFHFGTVNYSELYEPYFGDITTAVIGTASPYEKDRSLASQNEFRLIFCPARPVQLVEIHAKLPGLAKLVVVHDLRDRVLELKNEYLRHQEQRAVR